MIKSLKKFSYFLVSFALLIGFQSEAFAAKKSKTLNKTIKQDHVKCGVSQGLPDFQMLMRLEIGLVSTLMYAEL